jgi:arylsulfatase A
MKSAFNIFISLILISFIGCNTPNQKSNSEDNITEKPNIIFILADDLGWADLPSYGNSFNEAPNLDKLSDEGMQFSNAYAACPVCSPTRASIQSGQYPARVGIIDFITGHWRPYEEVIVPINRTQFLPSSNVTIAESMKSAGYATGYFGKWHLGFEEEHMPGNQGYDDWRVHSKGVFYNLKSSNAIKPFDETLNDEDRLSEVLTDYSINFIEKHKDKPFFLFLAHYDVHVQLDADQDLIDKYLKKEKKDDYPGNAIYAGMIEHIDRSVGRVTNKLKELGIEDNTMVVFFSDNGGLVSRFDKIPLLAKSKLSVYEGSNLQYVASSNAPLRGEKGTVYDGGIREPMIVKWPAKVKGGTKSESLISSVDFYPTFVELAGGELPSDQKIDGKSFLALLDEKNSQEERAIFWHYPVYHHAEPASAIRKGDWKLIHNLVDDHTELYNLTEDIGETNDLTQVNTSKSAELLAELNAWRKDTDARFPVKNPDFDPLQREKWGIHPDRGK